MQIPIDFYYYIFPGYLNILCLYMFWDVKEKKEETLKFTKDNALIIIPASVLIAFLLGFLVQTIITYIFAPLLSLIHIKALFSFFEQANGNTNDLKSENIETIYARMVFLRGLWIPMIYLAYEGIKYIWHSSIKKFRKFIMISIIVLSVSSVVIAWWQTRSNYISVKDNNNTQQIN